MNLKYTSFKCTPLEYQKRSGILYQTGPIFHGETVLTGCLFIPDGTNDITLDIYDGYDTSGEKITPTITIDGTRKYFGINFSPGLLVRDGIFFDITCAGSYNYQVYYD